MFLWWSPDTNMSLNWPISVSAVLVLASTPCTTRFQKGSTRASTTTKQRSVIPSTNLRDYVAHFSCFNLAWSCGFRIVLPVPRYTHFIQGHGPSHITVPPTFSKAFSKTCIIQSDPHHYTSGRWLRDDATQRQKRYIDFDIQLLCDRVVSLSPGATAVRSWQKKEGGFNRIFIMNLDSGSKLVAEIPYPGGGLPQRRATTSEVATIAYCTYIPSTDSAHLYDGALTAAIQYSRTRSFPSLE